MNQLKSILKIAFLAIVVATINFWLLRTCTRQNQSGNTLADSDHYTMENEVITLQMTKTGGMFTHFTLNYNPVNPFGWALLPEQMPLNNQPHAFAGHFLCTGRWGAPSEGEIAVGIPHNGEVNTQPWILVSEDHQGTEIIQYVYTCEAPIEKLTAERIIRLPQSDTWWAVTEKFTNTLPIARLSNFVQHATIAPPFLTENTLINTNTGLGFDQRTPFQLLDSLAFEWPITTLTTGERVDLTNPQTNEGFVTSHLFPQSDSLGWITAYNPENNLLLGYVFATANYPWLNYWHHNVDGKPVVRGLEFGTTGMGQPYKILLKENVLFQGKPSWVYMDAGETIEKSWICFTIQPQNGVEKVEAIHVEESGLTIVYLNKTGQPQQQKFESQIFHQLLRNQ